MPAPNILAAERRDRTRMPRPIRACCLAQRAGTPRPCLNGVPGFRALERPQEVNKELRALVESVTEERRASC